MLKDSSGNLTPVSWEDALVAVAKSLDSTPSEQIAALAGGMVDAESLMALKDLMNRLGARPSAPRRSSQRTEQVRI